MKELLMGSDQIEAWRELEARFMEDYEAQGQWKYITVGWFKTNQGVLIEKKKVKFILSYNTVKNKQKNKIK